MQIPALLYGRAGAVKSRAKKQLKGILESGQFDSLDPGTFIATGEVNGIVLVAPERVQLPGEHFHCYALTVAIFDLVPASQMSETLKSWIGWSLSEPWRFLGVSDQLTGRALRESRSLFKYVEAAVRFWPELKGEGARFGPFINEPQEIWGILRNLKYSLANLGIPADDLQVEPPGGPADFLARIQEDRKAL